MVQLGRTELGRGLKMDFEVIECEVAEGRMPALGLVIGGIVKQIGQNLRLESQTGRMRLIRQKCAVRIAKDDRFIRSAR